jgi:hypothetical protein
MIIQLEADFYRRENTPEYELWFDVLRLAVEDLTGLPGHHANSPLEWFLSANREIGSFRWLCSLFDLHPESTLDALDDVIDKRLEEWRQHAKETEIRAAWKRYHQGDNPDKTHSLGWFRRVAQWEKNGWPGAGFDPRRRDEGGKGQG